MRPEAGYVFWALAGGLHCSQPCHWRAMMARQPGWGGLALGWARQGGHSGGSCKQPCTQSEGAPATQPHLSSCVGAGSAGCGGKQLGVSTGGRKVSRGGKLRGRQCLTSGGGLVEGTGIGARKPRFSMLMSRHSA